MARCAPEGPRGPCKEQEKNRYADSRRGRNAFTSPAEASFDRVASARVRHGAASSATGCSWPLLSSIGSGLPSRPSFRRSPSTATAFDSGTIVFDGIPGLHKNYDVQLRSARLSK